MDPTLQTAIMNSTALSAQFKDYLLVVGPRLTKDQITKVMAILQNTEKKILDINSRLKQEKNRINADYVQRIKDIFNHTIPNTLKKIEAREKKGEAEELDSILSKLDKV